MSDRLRDTGNPPVTEHGDDVELADTMRRIADEFEIVGREQRTQEILREAAGRLDPEESIHVAWFTRCDYCCRWRLRVFWWTWCDTMCKRCRKRTGRWDETKAALRG